jgi:hypothetical protein
VTRDQRDVSEGIRRAPDGDRAGRRGAVLGVTDAGAPVGACAYGGTHDVTGSLEYVLGYQDAAGGVRFTPDQPVEVVVNLLGSPAKQMTRTASDGTFTVTLTPVEEGPRNNTLVEATDGSFISARARLTAYRPMVV